MVWNPKQGVAFYSVKYGNIFNNQKTSYIEIIKDELKEEKSETESENGEKLTDKSNYLNLLKNKENDMTIELNNNTNRGTPLQVRSAKLKSRKIQIFNLIFFLIKYWLYF